jgi:hypothetical protein
MDDPYAVELIATFEPTRRDDLRPEVAALIGRTFSWTYAGTQDDGMAYAGQTTWDSRDEGWPGYWVPICDLQVIETRWRFPRFHEGKPQPAIAT